MPMIGKQRSMTNSSGRISGVQLSCFYSYTTPIPFLGIALPQFNAGSLRNTGYMVNLEHEGNIPQNQVQGIDSRQGSIKPRPYHTVNALCSFQYGEQRDVPLLFPVFSVLSFALVFQATKYVHWY